MATIRDRIRAMNWYLQEAHLVWLAQELESWANAAIEGAGSAMPTGIALIGELDIATNLNPDCPALRQDPGSQRQTPGEKHPGIYQGFPNF